MSGLAVRAAMGLAATLFAMAALVFLPAWTLDYGQAWAFLIAFGTYSIAITIYLMQNDPALLERRVRGGPSAEKTGAQRLAMSFASFGFVATLFVSALDHRAHPFGVPLILVWAGEAFIAAGFGATFFVFRENPFSSATIEIAPEQRVVSSGPYALVRHPMYASALLYMIGMPLALGSWWGFAGVILLLAAIVWRLLDEEAFLAKSLPGYADYRASVKYRLVPYVW